MIENGNWHKERRGERKPTKWFTHFNILSCDTRKQCDDDDENNEQPTNLSLDFDFEREIVELNWISFFVVFSSLFFSLLLFLLCCLFYKDHFLHYIDSDRSVGPKAIYAHKYEQHQRRWEQYPISTHYHRPIANTNANNSLSESYHIK